MSCYKCQHAYRYAKQFQELVPDRTDVGKRVLRELLSLHSFMGSAPTRIPLPQSSSYGKCPTVVYATTAFRSHISGDALSSVTDLWWVRRCVATGKESDSEKSARAM